MVDEILNFQGQRGNYVFCVQDPLLRYINMMKIQVLLEMNEIRLI